MMKPIFPYKKLLALIFILSLANISYAQWAISINGLSYPTSGQLETYEVVWTYNGVPTTAPSMADFLWIISNGTIVSQTSTSATVTWAHPSEGNIHFQTNDVDPNVHPTSFSADLPVMITPVPPVATAATDVSYSSFKANWTSVLGATSYVLDVATDINFSSLVANYNHLSVTETSWNISGLSPTTTYYYKIHAVASVRNSIGSNVVSVTTLCPTPSVPIVAEATNITSNSFTANWNAANCATGYRLDVSKDNFVTFLDGFNNLLVSTTSQNITGLWQGTFYQYRVRAINNSGATSANSTTQTVTTIPANIENYVVTNTILVACQDENTASNLEIEMGKRSQSYQYIDGLGRPMQAVVTKGSPSKKDIVQPIAYDKFGREARKYLPYTDGSNGLFKDDALQDSPLNLPAEELYRTGKQYDFYQKGEVIAVDQHPYATTVFESNPLNRVVKQGSAGEAWQPNSTNSYESTDHTIKFDYQTNSGSEVLLWTYNAPSPGHPLGSVTAKDGNALVYYPAKELYVTKTKDEQQHEVVEYKDKEGRVILKKIQASVTEWAQTYYIYNDYGDLVVVLPPEAVKALADNNAQ